MNLIEVQLSQWLVPCLMALLAMGLLVYGWVAAVPSSQSRRLGAWVRLFVRLGWQTPAEVPIPVAIRVRSLSGSRAPPVLFSRRLDQTIRRG